MKATSPAILRKFAIVALSALSATLSACDDQDYYSAVADECDYDATAPLTDDCRDALQSIIPFDEESFERAPEGFKDKVMEAFRALISHPLALPPENRILGAAPYSLPMQSVCAIMPEDFPDGCIAPTGATDNPRQNAFNLVLQRVSVVRYGAQERPAVAHFGANLNGGNLNVYDKFWSPDGTGNTSRYSIIQAAALLHEARHADSSLHSACTEQEGNYPNQEYRSAPSDQDCDEDLGGAYGMNITYLLMALHGAAQKPESPLFTRGELNGIANTVCGYLYGRFNYLPDGIGDQHDLKDCGSASGNWILGKEGITLPL